MNRVLGWFSPSTSPTSHEAELGAPPPSPLKRPSGKLERSASTPPKAMSSPDSSNEAESNALGLSVDPLLNTPSEEVSPVNDSSSSLGRPTPKLKKQLSITSSRQRNTPTTQHTFLQRLSSFARRDKSNKANIQPTISPLTQQQHPADRNIHSYSEPVIQTIRASPEHMRGPSAVRDPDDAHKGSPLDHSLLGSPAGTPRLEQHTSPGRSGRSSTSPIPSHVNGDLPHTRKRLIVCCDGYVVYAIRMGFSGMAHRKHQDMARWDIPKSALAIFKCAETM